MMTDLSPHEYRSLIQAGLASTMDADTVEPDLARLFTPDSHRLALDPDVTVVRGARGVGKTVWFKALQDEELRAVAADAYLLGSLRPLRTLSGYGSERRPESYPGPSVFRKLLENEEKPLDIWTAVVLSGLDNQDMSHLATWAEKVRWVRESPEETERALAQADRSASDSGTNVLVLFDALDRLHEDRHETDKLVEGLLRLALDLRLSTTRLRAKVFIRPDMLGAASLHFPDASKVVANAADLLWSDTNLYGLFYHQLGNANVDLALRFRNSTPGHWQDARSGSRYVPPGKVTSDKPTQREIFKRIAGPYMGTDHRKGHTYSWLPNHLMDGAEQVSPRSFLSALAKAAEITGNSYGGHDRALHYDGIRTGVQAASRIRVDEIREDIPWVAVAVGKLSGLQVPMEKDVIRERWGESTFRPALLSDPAGADHVGDETIRAGPKASNTDDLVEELRTLGVMSYRADGRIDLPDVYRIAFNIGRKGGVPRVGR